MPMMIAPAASSRSTTVALYGGTKPSRMRDEAVVAMPRVDRLSLRAIGTPCSGPSDAARPPQLVELAGALERLFGGDRLKRVQRAVVLPNAIEIRLGDVPRPQIAGCESARPAAGPSESVTSRHPITRGTLNRPASSAASGALASASAARQRRVRDVVSLDRAVDRRATSARRRSYRARESARRSRECRPAGA